MSNLAVKHELQLTVQECIKCGMLFGVPAQWDSKRREDGQTFYCPNGHSQAYIEGPVEQLRKALDEEKRRVEAWKRQSEMHEAAAKRAQKEAKRIKTRVGNGVCPCCQRSFVNLQRHISSRHPDFQKQ
jgi:hypothetical protein